MRIKLNCKFGEFNWLYIIYTKGRNNKKVGGLGREPL